MLPLITNVRWDILSLILNNEGLFIRLPKVGRLTKISRIYISCKTDFFSLGKLVTICLLSGYISKVLFHNTYGGKPYIACLQLKCQICYVRISVFAICPNIYIQNFNWNLMSCYGKNSRFHFNFVSFSYYIQYINTNWSEDCGKITFKTSTKNLCRVKGKNRRFHPFFNIFILWINLQCVDLFLPIWYQFDCHLCKWGVQPPRISSGTSNNKIWEELWHQCWMNEID